MLTFLITATIGVAPTMAKTVGVQFEQPGETPLIDHNKVFTLNRDGVEDPGLDDILHIITCPGIMTTNTTTGRNGCMGLCVDGDIVLPTSDGGTTTCQQTGCYTDPDGFCHCILDTTTCNPPVN